MDRCSEVKGRWSNRRTCAYELSLGTQKLTRKYRFSDNRVVRGSRRYGWERVVINFGDTMESVEIDIEDLIEDLSGEVTIATPFHPDRTAVLPVRVSIPPHRLAVVVKP